MNDIFKDMQANVGCEYISDLSSYKRKVWHEMKRLNPADYEERQLEDFSKYVFGMSYQTLQDVMKQQKGREEQCRKQGMQRIIDASNFNVAYACLRQISFGLLDMVWYTRDKVFDGDVREYEREAWKRTQLLPPVKETCKIGRASCRERV